MHSARVLIVEDSPSLALTYREFLERDRHSAVIAPTAAAARQLLTQGVFSAVLLDLNLPDQSGIDFLHDIRSRNIRTPVIVITADPSIDMAVIAIKEGAQDFISKPVTPERLNLTLKNIIEKHSLKTIVESMQSVEREGFCDFIGKSPAMQVVYRIIENAAQSRAPVFITGESGTGKELAARAIHKLSPRKERVLEVLNCAAIPGTLLESEMFGHAKGAFTGAVTAHVGAAERAHHGTLFLDELGEMPMEMQSKMLRFTQSGTFRPVGGREEIAVDVRFVSATNRDPQLSVKEGRMREDLYYRLNVIPVHLPPLRERGDDILLIARALMEKIATEEKKSFRDIAADAEDFLMSYHWPGNIRQMQNVLRRAIVLHNGESLSRGMLPVLEGASAETVASNTVNTVIPLHDVERQTIEKALAFCGGNITEAARRLEINPSTLHRKLKMWKKA